MAKDSLLGKISFSLSIASLVSFILFMVVVQIAPEEESVLDIVIFLSFIGIMLSSPVSITIGIIDLFNKQSKKVLPSLGVTISATTILITIIIVIIGLTLVLSGIPI